MKSYAGLIIVRLAAEVSLKRGQARQLFLATLNKRISQTLERMDIPHRLEWDFNRLFIHTSEVVPACRLLSRVFGIGSFSPIEVITEADSDKIVELGAERFAERTRGRSFRVRVKKVGGEPLSTKALEVQLGAALNHDDSTVDLNNAEVTVYVEIQNGTAYLYEDRFSGPGGLPVGTEGTAVALISGGFDSAVAAWRILRRGVKVHYLFLNLGGSAYERMVLQVVKVLCEAWGFQYEPKFYAVDFSQVVEELRQSVKGSYQQLILKRMMYRCASKLAEELEADAVITGEAIGQVSSQTLGNLNVIDSVAEVQVLKPLIGTDKKEIIKEARLIGTATLSERIQEYCAISRSHPVTRPRAGKVQAQESHFDFKKLWRAYGEMKTIDMNSVSANDLRAPYLFTEKLDPEAVVIDCQPKHMFRAWHVPEAINYEMSDLMKSFRTLDKKRRYVLYCTYGTQTPYVAELMQQAGYEAYAFQGGISRMKKAYEAHAQARTHSGQVESGSLL